MTRGQLVADLLRLWEGSAKRLESEAGGAGAARDVRTAIAVLETTYTAAEMGITDMTYQEKRN